LPKETILKSFAFKISISDSSNPPSGPVKTKIFLFELYAYLKDPQYIPDCKHIIKTINNIRLDIFKI